MYPTNKPDQARRTDFSLRLSVLGHEHVAVGGHPRAIAQVSSKALSWIHRLHMQILPHAVCDSLGLLARLDALLCERLDLCAAVLEPDLDGALRHVDFLGDALTHDGGGCGVLVELGFEGDELVLCGALALLVLLLLGEGALPGRAARGGRPLVWRRR